MRLLLLILQQRFQAGKRIVCNRPLSFLARRYLLAPFPVHVPGVFVVVAKEAQQFPVAAVRGIVAVVMVLVMNRKLANPLA